MPFHTITSFQSSYNLPIKHQPIINNISTPEFHNHISEIAITNNNKILRLISIYVPTYNNQKFQCLSELNQALTSIHEDLLIGGDYNSIQDRKTDITPQQPFNNTNTQYEKEESLLSSIRSNHQLHDSFHHSAPSTYNQIYTNTSTNSHHTNRRIDFFLVRDSMKQQPMKQHHQNYNKPQIQMDQYPTFKP
ncbi:unnamed protein product [Ambrosiozyma monospora]|uniref:Unnamed protein product n=1 Tax=Ambrosiozyma monospora TaxID=43982 RepID=A0ACB5ST49_AMBMO|nr:unnamed protein product [Ambrosiozyma monospora]